MVEILRYSSLRGVLTDWIPAQRWFAGKARTLASVRIVEAVTVVDDRNRGGPLGLLVVVEIDGSDLYHVPVGIRRTLPPGAELMGFLGRFAVYDALTDPELVRALLLLVREDGLTETPVRSRVIGAEQSNTSVVVDERLILKVFRRLTAGVNPELELQRALAGSTYVPPLIGAIERHVANGPATLAVLNEFIVDSRDGWAAAVASLRDGSDFTADTHRLGRALAAIHDELAHRLGAGRMSAAALRGLSASLLDKLETAVVIVPALTVHEAPLRAAFTAVADLPPGAPVQRVHGDLHLGQTLRTADRWLFVDFEGEPGTSLRDRTERQSPMRDVAGMLRSFDYAADGRQAWSRRVRDAFLTGYGVAERDALLRVFELAKAVYETVYETRYRPNWAHLPLRAIAELTAG